MARIAGVDLPNDKRVEYALPYIFGIGLTLSREILAKTGINPDTRVRDLTEGEVAKIREVVDRDYKVEGDLRREESLNIKRLVEIGSYRGRRHRMNGQEPNERGIHEFIDQAIAALQGTNLPVKKAAMACVIHFSELGLVYERIAKSALKQANLDFL